MYKGKLFMCPVDVAIHDANRGQMSPESTLAVAALAGSMMILMFLFFTFKLPLLLLIVTFVLLAYFTQRYIDYREDQRRSGDKNIDP